MAKGSRNKVIAGEAGVVLGVINNVDKGLKSAAASFKKFGSKFKSAGIGIAAIGGGIIAPLAGITASFAGAGDALNKLSARSGFTVERLSTLKFAAEQSGSSIDSLGAALIRSTRRIGNAALGTGPAVRALNELGLEAKELTKLSPSDQFDVLVKSLKGVENEAIANQLAFEVFGDNFKDILPLLKEGTAGIKALEDQARSLGVEMSTGDAQAAADLTDALNRMKTSIKGVKDQIGAALAPVIADMLDQFVTTTKGIRKFIVENRKVFLIVAAVGAGLVAFGTALVGLGFALSAIGTVFSVVAGAITFLLSPIGLVIAGIAVLGVAVFKFTNFFGDALAWITERFGPLIDMIKDVGTVLFDTLANGDFAAAWDVIVDGLEATWLDLTMGIRETWNSTLDWMTDVTVAFAKGIGSIFVALGEGIKSLLDGYKSIYNGIFNTITEKLGELSGVKTLGGPVDAFGGQFGGIEDKIRAAAEGLEEFGKGMKDAAQQQGDAAKQGRADRAKEAQERLEGLRKGFKEEAKDIRERSKLDKLSKLPQLAAGPLGQFGPGGGTGQSGQGTFSSVAALFMGGGAVSPMERTAIATESIVGINSEILDQGIRPRPAVLGP